LSINKPQTRAGTVGHYFERISSDTTVFLDSFPGVGSFVVTNTTPLLIASVGQPMQLAGWAKQRSSTVTPTSSPTWANTLKKALTVTNGVKTTNQTGILSEYGEFLPTEPGRVILTTKPDLDQTTIRLESVWCM